jgi:hypothetical protein
MIEIDRLGEELEGTKLSRAASSLIVAIRGYHLDRQVAAKPLDPIE